MCQRLRPTVVDVPLSCCVYRVHTTSAAGNDFNVCAAENKKKITTGTHTIIRASYMAKPVWEKDSATVTVCAPRGRETRLSSRRSSTRCTGRMGWRWGRRVTGRVRSISFTKIFRLSPPIRPITRRVPANYRSIIR